MGTMQVVRGIGASISIEGRSFTKTGIASVIFIPAYKTLSGTVWHYWAVFGRSKSAVTGAASTPEYTAEYNLTVNGRQAYVLTLDNGAFESGTLTISGPGTIPATIQTGASGQWYDLTNMTTDNSALQEAELLLQATEQKQVAPRTPGGGVGEYKYATVTRSGNSTNSFTSSFDVKEAFSIPEKIAKKLSAGNFYGQVTAYNINREHAYPNSSIGCSITSYVPSTGMLTVRCAGNYSEIDITRYQVHAVWVE